MLITESLSPLHHLRHVILLLRFEQAIAKFQEVKATLANIAQDVEDSLCMGIAQARNGIKDIEPKVLYCL